MIAGLRCSNIAQIERKVKKRMGDNKEEKKRARGGLSLRSSMKRRGAGMENAVWRPLIQDHDKIVILPELVRPEDLQIRAAIVHR